LQGTIALSYINIQSINIQIKGKQNITYTHFLYIYLHISLHIIQFIFLKNKFFRYNKYPLINKYQNSCYAF